RLHHRPLDGLDRPLVGAMAPAAEALGELQDAISPATCLESTLDAHRSSPRPPPGTSRRPAAGEGRCGACGSVSCLLRQPVRQGLLEMLLVPAGQDQRRAETVLPLAVLAQGQVVAAAGLARLDLACPRHAEALHGAPLRLQLR